MEKYKLVSIHHVYKDDYTEGEGEMVNNFVLSEEIEAENPKDALMKYFDFLGCEVTDEDIESMAKDTDEDGIYHWSKQVDKDNCFVTPDEVEQWKRGKLTLYSDNFSVFIYELTRVSI
jgi:hypothetical protein